MKLLLIIFLSISSTQAFADLTRTDFEKIFQYLVSAELPKSVVLKKNPRKGNTLANIELSDNKQAQILFDAIYSSILDTEGVSFHDTLHKLYSVPNDFSYRRADLTFMRGSGYFYLYCFSLAPLDGSLRTDGSVPPKLRELRSDHPAECFLRKSYKKLVIL